MLFIFKSPLVLFILTSFKFSPDNDISEEALLIHNFLLYLDGIDIFNVKFLTKDKLLFSDIENSDEFELFILNNVFNEESFFALPETLTSILSEGDDDTTISTE